MNDPVSPAPLSQPPVPPLTPELPGGKMGWHPRDPSLPPPSNRVRKVNSDGTLSDVSLFSN